MYPHPRGKASPVEVGCFMFFAWPVLLIIVVIHQFFWLIGKLAGQED